jgi:Glutamine amidotransferase domain
MSQTPQTSPDVKSDWSLKRQRKISWADEQVTNKTLPLLNVTVNEYSVPPFHKGKNHLGIKVSSESTIEPITIYHGEITLLFLGRLYYQDPLGAFGAPEVRSIPELYKKYGIEYLLKTLQGTFSFLLLDQSLNHEESVMYIVTDVFGLIPMYFYKHEDSGVYQFSNNRFLVDTVRPVLMESAAYYRLTFSNKVNSIWNLDGGDISPKYYKYRILDGGGKLGQFPFSMIPEESDLVNTTHFIVGSPKVPSYKVYIIQTLHYLLYCAVQKLLLEFHQPEIICVGHADDPEFRLIQYLLEEVLVEGLEGASGAPLFTSIYIQDYSEETINYIRLRINQENRLPTTVFMSSGLLLSEERCREEAKQEARSGTLQESIIIDYDARFQKTLGTIVESCILPNIVEPLQSRNILVEFPLLEESWLNFYLSIFAKYRYSGYLLKRVAKSAMGLRTET